MKVRYYIYALSVFSPIVLQGDAAPAKVTHYSVILKPDFAKHLLQGEESIELNHERGTVEFQKQPGLVIQQVSFRGGSIHSLDPSVRIQIHSSGPHVLHARYTVTEGRGFHWLDAAQGFAAAFYCDAWMLCDNSPGQRASIRLEMVLPADSGLRPAGPGILAKEWRDRNGKHYLFEQREPVQTYLFSFAVARLATSKKGRFTFLTAAPRIHDRAFHATELAYRFLRSKATVDPIDPQYKQAFLPGPSMGQEAAGLALLSEDDLARIENDDDVWLMTHELAHQWWGALVGIRSWSDFWLNEGMASFMADVYLEQHQGREAYDRKIAEAKERMKKLHDRPLHWEEWKDAHEALGQIPYVKGVLVLDRLRTTLGDALFWRGISLYTSRYAGQLVDSKDFEQAMEDASGRNLKGFFDENVYH